MYNNDSKKEPTQRDYQEKIMITLMKFFRTRNAEDFALLMSPDNENSVLLNAVMQKDRPVISVNLLDDYRDVEIEDHNSNLVSIELPEGSLLVEYGESDKESKNSTVYVWVDDSGEVNYGVRSDN